MALGIRHLARQARRARHHDRILRLFPRRDEDAGKPQGQQVAVRGIAHADDQGVAPRGQLANAEPPPVVDACFAACLAAGIQHDHRSIGDRLFEGVHDEARQYALDRELDVPLHPGRALRDRHVLLIVTSVDLGLVGRTDGEEVGAGFHAREPETTIPIGDPLALAALTGAIHRPERHPGTRDRPPLERHHSREHATGLEHHLHLGGSPRVEVDACQGTRQQVHPVGR